MLRQMFKRLFSKPTPVSNPNLHEGAWASTSHYAIVEADGDTYAFGPFDSEDAAWGWEAWHRVALRGMMDGNMSLSRGGQTVVPEGAPELEDLEVQSPHDSKWDIIA